MHWSTRDTELDYDVDYSMYTYYLGLFLLLHFFVIRIEITSLIFMIWYNVSFILNYIENEWL